MPYDTRMDTPSTLAEAVARWADEEACRQYLASLVWPAGPRCPACGSGEHTALQGARPLYLCRECRHQYSVKIGTAFEDSPLPLSKWFAAAWYAANDPKPNSCELGRQLGVTQKTAWRMLYRIHHATNGIAAGFRFPELLERLARASKPFRDRRSKLRRKRVTRG